MADFLRTTNDWDLEAIVRGWGTGGGGAVVQLPPPPAPVLGFDWFEFEESEAVTTGEANELEELYKPFVGQVDQKRKNESPRSSQTEMALPCSSSFALFDHDDDAEQPKEMEMKESVDLGVDDHAQARSSCKRRKSKQKIVRVVHRGVGEDGVVMDKWNWRKYGQKAIKGSPYPRSYYRCSSSGGCHARKHVEQSKDDCHTFIVTYIADHSHAPPTRRHAQAGRKITKFSTTTKVVIPPPPSGSMTWTISDVDHQAADVGGTSTTSTGFVESSDGLQVMKDLLSTTSFDHDFNIWELDPFFTTSIC